MFRMSSYGKEETKILKKNLEGQLERLVQQLEDLDESREELDPEEYKETKRDTVDQMKELNESLHRILSGDMTLVDDLGAMQLAIQAAISESFKTPSVIRMFGKGESKQLRESLTRIQRNVKLGKVDNEVSKRQLYEILTALKQLGDNLSSEEMSLLYSLSYSVVDTTNFIQTPDYFENDHEVLAIVSQELRANPDS